MSFSELLTIHCIEHRRKTSRARMISHVVLFWKASLESKKSSFGASPFVVVAVVAFSAFAFALASLVEAKGHICGGGACESSCDRGDPDQKGVGDVMEKEAEL